MEIPGGGDLLRTLQGVVTPIHSVNSFATGVKVAVKRSRWIFRRGQEVKVNF